MPRITTKALKAYWRRTVEYENHGLSFKAFMEREAARAYENAAHRARGDTYSDAAWLYLQQK